MNRMNKNQIVRIIKECLDNEQISNENKKILLNLYLKALKVNKLDANKTESKSYLKRSDKYQELEDIIYFIDNKTLSDIDKIKFELYCLKQLKDNTISDRLQEVNNYLKACEKNDQLTLDNINYVKERIVEIQILSNRNVTFYSVVYDLLKKYCLSSKEEIKRR